MGWVLGLSYLLFAFMFEALIHYNQTEKVESWMLALCLLEMATWYFHYVHLNNVGTVHHGPFILGLITTCGRRMVSRMLVVAVSTGYGVVKPTLRPSTRNKIWVLGLSYLLFAFMFEALILYNQFDYDRKPKTTLGDTINIEMTES